MEIWAIEPEHAAILSGGEIGSHVQMGIGDGVIPEILNQKIYDEVVLVSDEGSGSDCERACQKRRTDVWNFQWNKRSGGDKVGEKTWKRENSCYDFAGYGRTLFFYRSF